MIGPLLWVVLCVLILASVLDIKFKQVPSVILTGLIFGILMLRPDNLLFGVISFVFAIMIKDLISDVAGLDFGVADIKIFTAFGLLLTSFQSLIIMILVFLTFQFFYTTFWRLKVNNDDEMPFIPCLLAVYVVMILIGGFA